MIQVFKIIIGICDINCEKFFEFTDYDVLEIHISNYVFNMLGHKIKIFLLVVDLHMFGILSYHN